MTQSTQKETKDAENTTSLSSEEEYRHLLPKLDLSILPYLCLIALLSFLDRSNIGNAKIAGLPKDLHLKGVQFNVAVSVFFITYAFAEVPSNIILKIIRPSLWFPSIMVTWGTVTVLMCLVKDYRELVVARVFLGLTEAGLLPGLVYYLSLWYRRRDCALRIAIIFTAVTLAGAFGGILAFGIQKMNGIGGLHGWQWIFCLEGLLTVVIGVGGYFVLQDYPETARFLTEGERKIVISVLAQDKQHLSTKVDRKFIWQAVVDYKTYVQMAIYAGPAVVVYSLALFVPSIIKELGYSAANAQLLTVPVFVIAAITTCLVGYLSDNCNIRGPFVIGSCLASLIGYIVLQTEQKPGVAYLGAIFAAMGGFSAIPVNLAWVASAAGGDLRKGVALAMVVTTGNLSAICSPFIYVTPPRFHLGHEVIMGWLSWSILWSIVTIWNYHRLNKKKISLCQRDGIDESRYTEFEDLGNESPLFRYTL